MLSRTRGQGAVRQSYPSSVSTSALRRVIRHIINVTFSVNETFGNDVDFWGCEAVMLVHEKICKNETIFGKHTYMYVFSTLGT
uniref:Uncharacterized protein n=1 Tax=Steinernema glaseri TaxID=37863 RepID=A0A1I8A5P5_9BILA